MPCTLSVGVAVALLAACAPVVRAQDIAQASPGRVVPAMMPCQPDTLANQHRLGLLTGVPSIPLTPGVPPFGHVEDYRWEGLAAGAIILGAAAAVMVVGYCSELEGDESCAGTFVLATVGAGTVGGIVGGLIGSWIPKGGDTGS